MMTSTRLPSSRASASAVDINSLVSISERGSSPLPLPMSISESSPRRLRGRLESDPPLLSVRQVRQVRGYRRTIADLHRRIWLLAGANAFDEVGHVTLIRCRSFE